MSFIKKIPVETMLSVLPLTLGTLVMIGWYIKSTLLLQIHPSFVPMQYNTALEVFLSGLAFILKISNKSLASKLLSAIILAIGLLTLLEYIFDVNIGIDELLMHHYVTVETSHPGRMAPNTALCFTLFSIWVFISEPNANISFITSWFISILVISLGLAAFLGYVFNLKEAYGWAHMTRMALHTSLGFLVLGLSGLIFFIRFHKKLPFSEVYPAACAGFVCFLTTATIWATVADTTMQKRFESISQVLILIAGSAFSILITFCIYFWGRVKGEKENLWIAVKNKEKELKLLHKKTLTMRKWHRLAGSQVELLMK